MFFFQVMSFKTTNKKQPLN